MLWIGWCNHLLVNDVLQTFEKMLNNTSQTTTQNLAIISFHNTKKNPKHYLDIAMDHQISLYLAYQVIIIII